MDLTNNNTNDGNNSSINKGVTAVAVAVACNLTSAELRERKETVIACLKQQIMEKKELMDGYAFKFPGSDKMVDDLTEFVKTERECCSFFTFTLSINGDKSEAWLQLTGGPGTKEFISSEIGF